MTLFEGKVGKTYKIESLLCKADLMNHLRNLGFAKGEELHIVSFLSGNFIVLVRDTKYGLEPRVAKLIEVSENVK